jgi:hypothetical protein
VRIRAVPLAGHTGGLKGSASGAFCSPDCYTERPSRAHTLKVVLVGLVAWGVPVAVVALVVVPVAVASCHTGQRQKTEWGGRLRGRPARREP